MHVAIIGEFHSSTSEMLYIFISKHSRAMRNLTKVWKTKNGPLQGDRALLGGLNFGFREVLTNRAGQKKTKN